MCVNDVKSEVLNVVHSVSVSPLSLDRDNMCSDSSCVFTLISSQFDLAKMQNIRAFCWLYFGLVIEFVTTMSWSEIPGVFTELFISESTEVNIKSSRLSSRVGDSCTWVRL